MWWKPQTAKSKIASSSKLDLLLFAYLLAMALVACSLIATHHFSSLAIKQENNGAELVNKSGRQRMLSQRILRYAQLTDVDPSPFNLGTLESALSDFTLAHQELVEQAKLRPETASIYLNAKGEEGTLDSLSRRFITQAEFLLDADDQAERDQAYVALTRLNLEKLLSELNAAVYQFEYLSKKNLDHVRSIQSTAMKIGLGILLLEVIVIFLPVHRTVRGILSKLEEEREKLLASEQRARQLSEYDSLTGLFNRRKFDEKLKYYLEDARKSGKRHILLAIDIDDFKLINNLTTYAEGDKLLIQLGQILTETFGQKAVAARLGGDEFAVIIPNASSDTGKSLANELASRCRNTRVGPQEKELFITISVGVCEINEYITNVIQLERIADASKENAKKRGKDQVYFQEFLEIDQLNTLEKKIWIHSISHALSHDLFELYVQEIIAREPNETRHHEVLVRMYDHNHEIVSPGDFIPCAEQYGLIDRIDLWVFDALCDWMHEHRTLLNNHIFSINISGTSLGKESFRNHVVAQISHYQLNPEQLCFEITETAAIENIDRAKSFINTLKALGCRFAIDDFGSGLSSFAYLKDFQADYLKIDGCFIVDISENPQNRAIVESMCKLGRALNLKVIAEYVKDSKTQVELEILGVDYYQGFYYSVPQNINLLLASENSKTAM